jgi:fructose-1,6-bisphosphatase/inositol monophosphatase family enzyme
MLLNPPAILTALRDLQRRIRDVLLQSRQNADLHAVSHHSSADTIYKLDLLIEPVIEQFCDEWSKTLPMVVVAEGLEPETGRTFPAGLDPSRPPVRIIMDPVDGTRGLMYDKRPAWSLAGAAPNKGKDTRLSDIEVAVMTELPTSKMAFSDVLWSIKGQGAHGERQPLTQHPSLSTHHLSLNPSRATTISHGFATISNFFPGTKVPASELMEHLALHLIGATDVKNATVFDDQYISTGGQFYELIVGHDRFIADLRPLFYALQGQSEGLCCHPYDCATVLIAREAGVIVTDGQGRDLDGPIDVTTGLAWAAFANDALRRQIEPLIEEFFRNKSRDA